MTLSLTGKQKSFLRSLAMTRKAVFQIGKDGITPALLQSVEDYVLKNELCKISLLESCPLSLEEAAEGFAPLGTQLVQTIGKTLVLFRPNPKLEKRIVLPK